MNKDLDYEMRMLMAKLRQEREDLDIFQKDIAKQIGVHASYISQLETLKIENPGIKNLFNYAEILGFHITLTLERI